MQVGKQPWAAWPLAYRLTAWYSLSAFILLVALTAVLNWALSSSLESETALLAERERTELVRILQETPRDFGEVREEVERSQDEAAETRVWIRVVEVSGEGRSVESNGMSELGMRREVLPAVNGGERLWSDSVDVQLSSGVRARGFAGYADLTDGGRYEIQVFVDTARLQRIASQYRSRTGVIAVVAFAGFSLVGYAIARRGLAPLRSIASSMEEIRSTTTARRVERKHLPSELWTLATAFNEVLDRLDEVFLRMERSSADIAHELRTPLTRMRLAVEVALQSTNGAERYREALGTCLEEAVELSQLIDRVLFLARREEPLSPTQGERIAVSAELLRLTEFYDAAAAERNIALSNQCVASGVVRADRGLFLRAISNLIENALAHTRAGDTIKIVTVDRAAEIEITVTDSGCGIPAEHLGRIFDPFTRVDAARSEGSGGAGLGLAIVKKIVALHRGSVAITSAAGRGTTVTLVFPVASKVSLVA